MISIFDLFSIGIGPSSSHTVGPMRAAKTFIGSLQEKIKAVRKIEMTLYGSLAFTGLGHHTDRAILMGLMGESPETIDPNLIKASVKRIEASQQLALLNHHIIHFNPATDLTFDRNKVFDYHPNAIQFRALDNDGNSLKTSIFYSIGGGFIVNDCDIQTLEATRDEQTPSVPYPFLTANDLLTHCDNKSCSIADIMRANEMTQLSESEINNRLLQIAATMEACINKGCQTEGVLEGPLKVRRRAANLYKQLIQQGQPSTHHPSAMNWLNVYALAVNEENAAGKRIVTAPTNGAAGIIPAVLNYYKYFSSHRTEQGILNFLLTAGAIGILYKQNASISGAEMGCQGEVGVACSMAAGGLAAALGGTIHQVENAAEIAMEHNLGLTCDPVAGLVQIPCIERNAMGAVKAVNAAELALLESGTNKVSLDMVIQSMREIGHNMNSNYKETSLGGLAVAVSIPDC